MTRRVGEAMELEPLMRRPLDGKVISMNAPNYQQQQQNFQQPIKLPVNRQYQNSPREVSETDLYLLGAIEKLVYRVDYMEKRLKRTEQLVYYLMAGNKERPEADPCQANFTRIGGNCYHFGGTERVDWKTAAGKCKALGASLAEFDKVEKFRDVVAYVLNNQSHRGHDFWTGGLNPGLQNSYDCRVSLKLFLQVFCGFGQLRHGQ